MAFAVGAFLPLLPWLWTSGGAATLLSIVIATVASLVVGPPWPCSPAIMAVVGDPPAPLHGVPPGPPHLIGHAIGTTAA